MTPTDFATYIEGLINDEITDPERLHSITDKAMENLLISLGYGEAVAMIRNQTRWYA